MAGFLWRIRGPIGQVEVQNERVPDVRAADFLIVPMMVAGFLLISSRPGSDSSIDRGHRHVLCRGYLAGHKTSVPGTVIWSGPGQHGVHVGDLAAIVPILIGLQILIRSRVPPPRYHALHALCHRTRAHRN